MGARGPLKRPSNALTVAPLDRAPRVPGTLGKAGKLAWRTVWSECGSWLALTDQPDVERLARLHDEEAELVASIKKAGRTTRGSQGQLVDHPLVGQLRAVEVAIHRLEQLLGLGPLHRARLGIAVAKAATERSNAERALERYRAQLQET